MSRRRFAVYHLEAANGQLLYIGQTGVALDRFRQHEARTWWWTLVATIRVEHHATREDALAAERTAIAEHRPPFNNESAFGLSYQERRAWALASRTIAADLGLDISGIYGVLDQLRSEAAARGEVAS